MPRQETVKAKKLNGHVILVSFYNKYIRATPYEFNRVSKITVSSVFNYLKNMFSKHEECKIVVILMRKNWK